MVFFQSPAAAQTPLACGETISSSISAAGERDFYVFAALAADEVTIRMVMTSSIGFSPRLELYAPDGTLLMTASGSSIGSGSAARIDITLSTSGIYTLIASDLDQIRTGNYSLVWQRPNNPCGTTPLSCGQLVATSIGAALELDLYALEFAAGDEVTIRMVMTSSIGFSPRVELYAPDGTLLTTASGSSIGSGSAARIDITLSTSGIYTLIVNDSGQTRSGNYSLVWQRPNNPCGTTPLSCGQLVATSIGAALELDLYALEFAAGDEVTIRMVMTSSIGFSPRVELYAPDGTLLTTASGSSIGSGSAARIDITLSTSGIYTLIASDLDQIRTGNYSLVWERPGRLCAPLSISFSVSPSSLSFSAPAGSALTPPQQLELRSDFPGLPWRATVRILSGGIWLSVSSDFGQMPAAIQVTADATDLSAGTYEATIEILAADASPSSQTIEVTFTVRSGNLPGLTVDPGNLRFQGDFGEAVPGQSLRIGNSGTGTLSWQAQASTTSGNWLSVSPPSGLVSASSPATLQVSVNSSGLDVGFYSGTILVSSPETNQTLSVRVGFSVSSDEGVLLLSQSGLLFRAVEEGGAEPPQTVGVLNIGGGALDWFAEPIVRQSVSWLQITPSSGRSVAGSTAISQVTIAIDHTGLSAGFYVGLVRFSASAANNSPQTMRVDLQVLPRGTPLGAVVRPTGLIFVGVAGGAAPPAQEIGVATPEAGPIEFISAPVGGDWVSRTPDSGTAARETPGRIAVQAQPGSLTPSVYRAGLTVLTKNDGELHPVNLLLVLLPEGSVAAASVAGSGAFASKVLASACSSTRLLLQFTSVFARFNAAVGWPTALALNMRDDCGNPAEGGAVVLTFSSGDPPLALTDLNNGQYVGSWRPNKVSALVVVTARGSWEGLESEAKATAIVSSNPDAEAAILNQGGVVLGAGFTPGPVAPGSIVSLFGRNMADQENSALSVPLPQSLGGVRVLIGEKEAPLFYVGPGQVNVQVPVELAPDRQLQVVVETNGVPSAPEPLQTAGSRPGIFTLGPPYDEQGAILIANTNRLAMPATPGIPSEPARIGRFISIYCTGLGATDPTVPSGQPATSEPLAVVKTAVTVLIGEQPAAVNFAGLAPGFVGVYQVNAEVPPGITAGDAIPVVLIQGGVQSNTATIAVQ